MRKQDKLLVIQNYELYQYYRERLISMALSQFEWSGLPDTCDRRYFEKALLFQGTAAFLKPKGTDFWVSLPYIQKEGFTIYGYPKKIMGYGYNAENIETDEFEILYDNQSTNTGGYSLLPKIDLYARLLWEIHNTIRANLRHQNTPYIVTSTRDKSLSIKNFFNRIFGYEPVIQVSDGLNVEEDISTIDLRVDFKGNELMDLLRDTWAEALSILGISAMNSKKERLITGEMQMDRQADIISLQSRLLNRVDFCNKMNKKYGLNMSVNLSSVSYDIEEEIRKGIDEDGSLHTINQGDSTEE